MAPKKKGGGGKKAEAPKDPGVEGRGDIPLPENCRDFYLIQIRDLEGRLARYQRKWDERQVNEGLFRMEHDKTVRNNKEIVAFLKKTLNQRVDEIADVNEQLNTLQQAKDTEKDAFEVQLAQVRHEFQETKDQLTTENMMLSGKLAALEEFRIQKEEYMAKFAALEDQLKKQEEAHKEYTYNLERKVVLDKERLKKEMVQRVNMVAAEFRKISNSQMAETTKRAIRENVAISLQLTKMSDCSCDLIQENDRLKEAQAEAQKQLELLEHNEKTMAKNSLSNQKVGMIGMLTSKCKEQQVLVDEYMQQKAAMAQLEEAYEALQRDNKVLRYLLAERVLASRLQPVSVVNRNPCCATAPPLTSQERPTEEEDGHFDVLFQLRRNEALQSLLALLRRGSAARARPQQEFQLYRAPGEEQDSESAADRYGRGRGCPRPRRGKSCQEPSWPDRSTLDPKSALGYGHFAPECLGQSEGGKRT
uniref:Cilia- and flagella-associated protein 157 n=1 Tax=Sphenodon punctatus TaxID=8508 RepID=A0A8D0LAB3_SPHPU